MKSRSKTPQKLKLWIDARKRHKLSHAQVQMARELGMNPKTLGGLANHGQESWKAPLPQFIEGLYLRRFGRECPELVCSIEERVRKEADKKSAKKARKLARLKQEAEEAARGEGPG